MAKLRYTKEHLENIVMTQLENLEAMGDLLRLVKEQNDLLQQCNQKLKEEISGVREKMQAYPTRTGRKRKS